MTQAEKAGTAAAVSGRATGVLFFAGFGSLWLYNGLTAMHRLTPIGVAAIFAIAVALAVPAMVLIRTAAMTVPAGAEPDSSEQKRGFMRVNLLQWGAVFAAVVLFNTIHRPEFLTPVITFIVGAHLIPLARLFHYATHYVTGSLLMAWATLLAMIFPGGMMPSVGAVGTAAILLGSAAWTLLSAGRAARTVLGGGTSGMGIQEIGTRA